MHPPQSLLRYYIQLSSCIILKGEISKLPLLLIAQIDLNKEQHNTSWKYCFCWPPVVQLWCRGVLQGVSVHCDITVGCDHTYMCSNDIFEILGNTSIHFLAESWIRGSIPLSCLYPKYETGVRSWLGLSKDWKQEETASLGLSKGN